MTNVLSETGPHPEYGPCDALGPKECCAECLGLRILAETQLSFALERMQLFCDALERLHKRQSDIFKGHGGWRRE